MFNALRASQNSLLDSIEEGSPSDNSLLLLSSFFGSKLLTQALEMVDAVVKISCQTSGRSFFRIQGTDASPYLVICSFCTCRAFEGHALAGNRALLCKHSLAAILADKWKVPHARCSCPVSPALTVRVSLAALRSCLCRCGGLVQAGGGQPALVTLSWRSCSLTCSSSAMQRARVCVHRECSVCKSPNSSESL
jgi:hypothetical protein